MRVVALAAAAVLALAVGGCGNDPNSVAAQAQAGDRKGYISGDGSVEQIPAADRGEPVDLSGPTVTGGSWAIDDVRGKVVVVNKWGSWCPPCVSEADDLQRAWTQLDRSGKDVAFVGIDFRESPETGAAFIRSKGITYPSLSDESGTLVLNLQGKASATPTTLVLDPEGRIAARVLGAVDTSTLTGLVDDVLAES
jgi:peroxiredoxin